MYYMRLRTALVLISMDRTKPYHETMGITFSKKTDFISAVRDLVIWERAESAHSDISASYSGKVSNTFSSTFGRDVSAAFSRWLTHVFEYAPTDYPQVHAWSYILTWCAGNPQNWRSLGLPPSKGRKLLAEFKEDINDEDVSLLVNLQKQQPLSAWDSEVYSTYGFDDDALDPYNWILSTIDMIRFRLALAKLCGQLSESEIDELRNRAQLIGLRNGLTKIVLLASPDGLEESAE
jgi:hypothetical protein